MSDAFYVIVVLAGLVMLLAWQNYEKSRILRALESKFSEMYKNIGYWKDETGRLSRELYALKMKYLRPRGPDGRFKKA